MISMPTEYSPMIDIPTKFVAELSAYTVGDKVSGEIIVEVVGKTEQGVDLRVTSMSLNIDRRVKT